MARLRTSAIAWRLRLGDARFDRLGAADDVVLDAGARFGRERLGLAPCLRRRSPAASLSAWPRFFSYSLRSAAASSRSRFASSRSERILAARSSSAFTSIARHFQVDHDAEDDEEPEEDPERGPLRGVHRRGPLRHHRLDGARDLGLVDLGADQHLDHRLHRILGDRVDAGERRCFTLAISPSAAASLSFSAAFGPGAVGIDLRLRRIARLLRDLVGVLPRLGERLLRRRRPPPQTASSCARLPRGRRRCGCRASSRMPLMRGTATRCISR